jgi:hypothetical protein
LYNSIQSWYCPFTSMVDPLDAINSFITICAEEKPTLTKKTDNSSMRTICQM